MTINPTCNFHGNKGLLISNDIIHVDEYAGVHDFYSDIMQRQWTNLISCSHMCKLVKWMLVKQLAIYGQTQLEKPELPEVLWYVI